ncbi:UDP-2,4-diacetamido-2,4,6-trideoxy-beta-L-altropyranose hydrolase [Desulfobacter hydrogenophilus]|uniref:UDP-2,4-diacetamido-2,4, 6-trideoxy-beta-L-altropyranose hydrolase n=1 Tax=Desulfobacter hydrogenophilus TaxID=2291 RepID=A0A328FCL9_9BACT|nr:UDP-2,4-diacetamido-2,4,6-trideoxy-beta-L-altropyranose hydrolase [Desulfobacter hydrogenophilus]NDY73272.1 UDP-2,4-diacetamido-2,4,6-trideoxy-beta-L-altropyranose hydrolase [Desulfobacter hydrogenophilus]QBH13848.1 UDP-2,4-diacetamido-2,4,6-trideoxy-beta-L-altropyranose hydrolase [Desulfobacter hydrogenophilus]RAM00863.1 UDP-2,4-diacetamido-2,4,6-trideoxy-beta-L-altropyranose hydrolase [Desulfobacter hydrogenophilus]
MSHAVKIVFRTDASLQIGTGHVMRCLTLAEALKKEGAQCHFISREHPGNLFDQIKQQGFIVKALPATTKEMFFDDSNNAVHSEYASWLGTSWTTDAEQTKSSIGNTVYDWLIVDHYALDEKWEKELRPKCRNIMVIDDLADRSHDCDLLLDQNLGRDQNHYNQIVPKNCTVLTGPHYALLRPEFAALRDYSLRRRVNPKFKHLMISMGGVDQINATGKILEAIKECELPNYLRITVVMGLNAPWLLQVKSLAEQLPQSTEVMVNVQNMAQLMTDSDLAIGAAGSTSWERCCLGLPSIIVILAENQQFIANSLQSAGAAKTFSINDDVNALGKIIKKMIGNTNEAPKMSAVAASITDGNGINKITTKLQAMTHI